MGKRLYENYMFIPTQSNTLGISGLLVVDVDNEKGEKSPTYHTVHESYFQKRRFTCPCCGSTKTVEKKNTKRYFKDILSTGNVIDLCFHQRYYLCTECGRVFHEDQDFAEKGCRYTNRLSDLLAEGTLTQTYERVCKRYGVPASKTSVGVIMRRRLKQRTTQLPLLETPSSIVVFVAYYFNNPYPVVLGLYDDDVRFLDILSESSISAYSVFFNGLDKNNVQNVFIDPDEQLHNAVAMAFPGARILVSEECVIRHVRDCFKEVIKKDGARSFLRQPVHTLCKEESFLDGYEQKKVSEIMRKRPRLSAAYRAYQDLLADLGCGFEAEKINNWLNDLKRYIEDVSTEGIKLDPLDEFDVVRDVLGLYEAPIKEYLALETKPPRVMPTAVQGILEALEEMPYCIYDILHARMLLCAEQEIIVGENKKYRKGIPINKLTEAMKRISLRIKKEKDIYGYEPED